MPGQGDNQTDIIKVGARPRDLTDVSRAVLRSEQAKRWTKRYRTEVAASSSSLLSTFVAVSLPDEALYGPSQVLTAHSILWTLSRHAFKRE
jgi:hypothetical protein